MDHRRLGRTGLNVSAIGFGAFKIGRNEKVKYAQSYPLPTEEEAARLLNRVLDLGITLIDTAPAYGLSEERIGRALAHRRKEFTLSTKVGETFEDGRSHYDFSAEAVRASIERSQHRLRTDVLDLVFIHSDGRDMEIQRETDCVKTLQTLRERGLIRAIGFSGKTVEGAMHALDWADALMIEYHMKDQSHAPVIEAVQQREIGVIIKKGLASGTLAAGRDATRQAIRFVTDTPGVSSLVIGGLNEDHLRENIAAASG
ncbi:MAG: aldo/keto reductase [Phycisphaerales bacterium]|nr:MAG: aldo/keto reductase [Phycisphaerales bacterium]